MKLPAKNKFRAAALMLALWALFLLSAMVISWALDIDTRISLSGNANRVLEAEAMACSGTEVALHPAVKPGSSVLKGDFGSTQHYEVRITGEGGRLNLNWLLAGENPVRLEMLRRYLEMKGVDLNERDRMIDCLLDWVDPDNLVRLNGAENEGDYQPPNELLTRIEDLKKVKGWKDFTATPGWEDDFTAQQHRTGRYHVGFAFRSARAPGNEPIRSSIAFSICGEARTKLKARRTISQLQSLEEVRTALGLSPEQFKEMSPLIGFRDPVERIISIGKSGSVTRVVQMVVRKTGNIPQLITWKEL